jgi:lysozyme family protein
VGHPTVSHAELTRHQVSTLLPNQEFARCVQVVLQKEGWGVYTNSPSDPGGPTRWGITLAALSAWRHTNCTAADVMNLGEDEALAIYRQNYWHVVAGDQLPGGIDLMTFDCAVNQGPGHAIRWLQGAAGVTADGIIGPATLAAVKAADPTALINAFKAERLNSYESDSAWSVDGNGWTARDDSIAQLSIEWATA